MRAAAALLLCLAALAGCGDDGPVAGNTGTLSSSDCEQQLAAIRREAKLHPGEVNPEDRKTLEAAGSGGGVLCASDVDVLTQPSQSSTTPADAEAACNEQLRKDLGRQLDDPDTPPGKREQIRRVMRILDAGRGDQNGAVMSGCSSQSP
jgi:hypothetical protein